MDARDSVNMDDNTNSGLGGTDQIVSDILDNAPPVNESSLDQMLNSEKDEKQTIELSGFDPEKHQVDENGQPILTPTGRFKKISKAKPRDRSKQRSQSSVVTPDAVRQAETRVAETQAAALALGTTSANMLVMIGLAIGGEEWKPMSDPAIGLDEQAMLTKAFSDYYIAKDMTDLPPGVALALTVGMYALPRLSMPKTQERLKRLKSKMTKKQAANDDTQSDTGTDAERKIDTGKTVSA